MIPTVTPAATWTAQVPAPSNLTLVVNSREQCLEHVQPEDYARPNSFVCTSVPAFLIHDGGGTIFSYHCLEPMKRNVYGIRNPHFRTGDIFAGGLPEMGRLYANWIRRTVAQRQFPAKKNVDGSVDIVIGGWSLGGLLSLEVAKELEDDWTVRVVGILMIDSIYPFKPDGPLLLQSSDPIDAVGAKEKIENATNARERNQLLTQRAMAEARRMLKTWQVPRFDGYSGRPRVILLRATQFIPTEGPGISVIDAHREDKLLGWDRHDKKIVDEVIDIEGHHFDLFLAERISATSEVVRRGLNRLANFGHFS